MKFRTIALLTAAMLLLTACGTPAMESRMDAMENTVESGMESVGETIKDAVETMMMEGTTQPSSQPSAAITREEAEAIALNHAGFTADQVSFLRTEYEIDDRIPQYEVEFHHDRWEYNYEINAETGDILSYDRDD